MIKEIKNLLNESNDGYSNISELIKICNGINLKLSSSADDFLL